MSSMYNKTHVLLQGFNWNSWRHNNKTHYRFLQFKSRSIKEAGIDGVWFPPPVKSLSPQGYMPIDMYTLDSQYGSLQDLQQCIETFHNDDLDVYADLVLNHRCAEFQDSNGVYNVFGGRMAWDNTAIVGNHTQYNGKGNPKSQAFFEGAPNIDHSQSFVREDIVQWLLWLKTDVQFDGFRFDFALGYDGKYVKEYVERSDMKLVVGEYWDAMAYQESYLMYNQDSHRQRIVDWIDTVDGKAAAFDMTTKGILQHTLNTNEYYRLADTNNQPPGVLGWWPQNTVTFLDNHDTHCDSQNHWPFPTHRLIEGYSYILTHPGIPMIYWDHFNDIFLKDILVSLIQIRKTYEITSESKVDIIEASNERYHAIVDQKVSICIGQTPVDSHNVIELFKHDNVLVSQFFA